LFPSICLFVSGCVSQSLTKNDLPMDAEIWKAMMSDPNGEVSKAYHGNSQSFSRLCLELAESGSNAEAAEGAWTTLAELMFHMRDGDFASLVSRQPPKIRKVLAEYLYLLIVNDNLYRPRTARALNKG
jgi:hypothetical protein